MKELLQFVQPTGPLPDLVGSKIGRKLLVIGSAMCVWDDLQRFPHEDCDLMGINDMMMHFPGPLTYGATVHPDKLPGWAFFQAYNCSHKMWKPMETHSHMNGDWVKYVWPLHRQGGTSGLFGVTVGILMGYDQIIVAGIPCDDSPRFFDPPWERHEQFGRDTVVREWQDTAAKIFNGRVKSLSGRTREILGEP